MNTNNNIAPIIEEQEEQNTVQELPKQKEKSGILKKITNLITSVALTTMVILTPQKSAKSEGTKLQDNLKMKPLKSNSLVMKEDQQQAPYLEKLYNQAKGISQEDQTFSGPSVLVASNDNVMSDDNGMLLASIEQTKPMEAIKEGNNENDITEKIKNLNLSQKHKGSLIELSDRIRKDREKGIYAGEIEDIWEIPSLETKKDLDKIANSLDLAPNETFKEITTLDYVQSVDQIPDVIRALWDTKDIPTWFRVGKDKTVDEEATKKHIEGIKENMEKWLKKFSYTDKNGNYIVGEWEKEIGEFEFDKDRGVPEGTTYKEFMNDALTELYYTVGEIPTELQTRETWRRVFMDIFGSNYDNKTNLLEDANVVYGVTEQALLSKKDKKGAIVIRVDGVNYMILAGKDPLKGVERFEKFNGKFESIIDTITRKYNDNAELIQAEKKSEELDNKIVKLDEEIAQDKKEIAQDKKEIAQDKKEIAQLDEEIAQLEKMTLYEKQGIELLEKANKISKKIVKLIDLYRISGKKEDLRQIKISIKKLKNIEKDFESLKKKQTGYSQKLTQDSIDGLKNRIDVFENGSGINLQASL